MARTLNRFQCIGNLGRDPEGRSLQDGSRVVNLSVGCSDNWTDKNGEKKSRTFWAKIVVFGRQADAIEKYLRKGDRLFAEGRLVERKWQDQSGTDRYSTEVNIDDFNGTVQFLNDRRDADAAPRQSTPSGDSRPAPQSRGWDDGGSDECPF